MIKILSCNSNGVTRISVSTLEELNSLNKDYYSPTSMVIMAANNKIRYFILSGDKTNWIEIKDTDNVANNIPINNPTQQFYYDLI